MTSSTVLKTNKFGCWLRTNGKTDRKWRQIMKLVTSADKRVAIRAIVGWNLKQISGQVFDWESHRKLGVFAVHPGYSAAAAFERIDSNIRAYLHQRHVPLVRENTFIALSEPSFQGYLAMLEEHLVEFFRESPDSVYLTTLSSSFERMLLHALCQYLGLHSRSRPIARSLLWNSNLFFQVMTPIAEYETHWWKRQVVYFLLHLVPWWTIYSPCTDVTKGRREIDVLARDSLMFNYVRKWRSYFLGRQYCVIFSSS